LKIKKHLLVNYSVAAIIAFLAFLVFLPSLQNDFVDWDDYEYVYDNFHIRSLDGSFFRWAFGHFYNSNWHPITWISHAIDFSLWGLNPIGHHLTNNALHALNTFLVIVLVMRLIEERNYVLSQNGPSFFLNRQATLIAAGVTGLLFGLHPVHVESVAWVAERKDLLCALFFLLSIIMYTKYLRLIDSRVDREKPLLLVRTYLSSLGFFILALLSKPMAVSLPAVLIILDWYPYDRYRSLNISKSALLEKLPFILLSCLSSALTVAAQKAGASLASIEEIPLSTRLLTGMKSLSAYLGKMIIPLDLIPFYPYPTLKDMPLLAWEYLSAIIIVIAITAACLVVARKQKLFLSAWSYYVITLVPVLGIVQVGSQAMADRYTYLPSIGILLVVGVCVSWLLTKKFISNPWIKPVSVFVIISSLVLMAYLTYMQIGVWRNSIDLWSYVIEKEPQTVPRAYYNRGVVFYRMRQFDKAITDFDKAISLRPSYYKAYNNRGLVLAQMGHYDLAIENYNIVIDLRPLDDTAYYNRGLALNRIGEVDRAKADFDRSIQLNPLNHKAYIGLGIVHGEKGLYSEAINDFNKAISLQPGDGIAYVNRGYAYSLRGSPDLAVSDFQKACDAGSQEGCKALQEGGK